MSDAPGTTTPATDTATTPAPSADPYASSFPSMAKEAAPPPPAADPDEAKWRAAFPSMYPEAAPASSADTMSHASAQVSAATEAAPAGETPDAPPGEPVALAASGLEVSLPAALHLDSADLQAFDSAAKDLGLDAPAAQRLLDMHAQGQANLTAAADAAFSETVAGWREAVAKDPEVGGARFKETVAAARQTIERFGSPALREILNQSGLGSHPEVVRFVHRVGRALAAAEARGSQADGPAPERDWSASFPSMYRK